MIAVTGAGSPLGAKIVKRLSDRGEEVREIDNIEDMNLQGCQSVYHCLEHFDLTNTSQDFYETNVVATEKVLRNAAAAGVKKTLIVSSIAAAGPDQNIQIRTEDDTPAPLPAPYQETKRMAEESALRIAAEENLDVVIVRPTCLVGKGMRFPALWFAAYANSSGRTIPCGRDYLYNFIGVDDAAAGCMLAMEKGKAGEIYNLASSKHLTLHDTLTLFSELSGLPPVRNVVVPLPLILLSIHLRASLPGGNNEALTGEFIENYLTWNWIASNEKARNDLGFDPEPIDRYWRETICWAAEQGFLRKSAAARVKDFVVTCR
ncbi:MAG: NAD-dependent epimerase/dehydratase family protein [Bacillota bacterium]|nr:NAD-dependent epimerase/dehydratase family protein [Bacillota bacterium]MDW7682858.1 NAD-dependent epimerase/dehydratase family protein [Bacillota bacterium]